MASITKILAFAGSSRSDSFNKKLVKVAAEGARGAGAEVTFIDLRDYPMPIYDGDLETQEGLPENAKKLKKIFLEHHGLLVSSPEYNSSISALLKNAIDWVSRPVPGESPLACFDKKVVGLMAASPGALGGLRGLVTVRSIFGNIKCTVIPEQVAVAKANEAFAEDGTMKDEKQQSAIKNIGAQVATVASKLHGTELKQLTETKN
ncbi:MAG: NADPH-dependent oxidoreductase [Candidatus Melainabacteria bacterium]|nr:MAG: NADPH-dependent oxidoreductase [Candidatus Melainabacteria bacterium]